MQRKTKENIGDITRVTLMLIAKGALVSLGAVAAGARGGQFLEREFGGYTNVQIRRSIRNMRLRGYIEYDKNDLESPLRVTAKGLVRVAKLNVVDRFTKSKDKRWDHLWRVVMFDIPERRKRLRDLFRNGLDELGFYQFQESVYVCPFDCEVVVEELKKIYRLERNVCFTVFPHLGWRERSVRRWFIKRNEL